MAFKNNATFDIVSEVGVGTFVKIGFKFTEENFLGSTLPDLQQETLVVDDDPKILEQWKRYLGTNSKLSKYFSCPADFERYYNNSNSKEKLFVIMDYRFYNDIRDGLTVLLQNKVINAVVSSGDYSEVDLQRQIKDTGYKLYPKLFFKSFSSS